MALLGLCGCLIGEEPPSQKLMSGHIGTFDTSCIRDVPPNSIAYFSGELRDDAKIAANWDCASQALVTFRKLVRGKVPGRVDARDLVDFLNGYLKPQDRITPELLQRGMQLKTAFIGGDTVSLTNAEIDRTLELLETLKAGTLAVKDLMPLTEQNVVSLGQSRLDALTAKLGGVATAIGAFADSHGGGYALSDAIALLAEVERIYVPSGPTGSGLRWVRTHLPVLAALKAVAAGGANDRLDHGEWARSTGLASRLYGTYLSFVLRNRMLSGSWLTDPGFDALSELAVRALSDLGPSASYHPDGVVPGAAVRHLLNTLADVNAADSDTPGFSRSLALAVLGKQVVLGSTDSGSDWYDAIGIDLKRLPALADAVKRLAHPAHGLYQIFFQTDIASLSQDDYESLVAQFELLASDALAGILAFKTQGRVESVEDFRQLLATLRPLYNDESLASQVESLLNAAIEAKPALAGPPAELLSPDNWKVAAVQAIPAGKLYLESKRIPARGSNGAITQEQLDHAWTMVGYALDVVEDGLEASPSSYRISDSDFVALIDGLPDSFTQKDAVRALLPDVLALKQAWLGGDSSSLRLNEVRSLRSLLAVVRTESENLRPYLPLRISTWPRPKVEAFAAAIERATSRIGGALATTAGSGKAYPFARLETLAKDLEPLTGTAISITPHLPLVSAAKSTLIGGDGTRIDPSEWQPLLARAGHWGALGVLGMDFFNRAPDWTSNPGRDELVGLVAQALSLIRQSAAEQPQGEIAFTTLDQLFDAVYGEAALQGTQLPLELKTLKDFSRPAVRRLLGGYEPGPAGRKANGLGTAAIDLSSARIQRWVEIQDAFEKAFLALGGPGALNSTGFENTALEGALAGVANAVPALDLLHMFRPLFMGNDVNFSFLYDGNLEKRYSFGDLSRKNLYRFLVQALLEGYAEDLARAKSDGGLTLDELTAFVTEAHDMIHDLRFGSQTETDAKLASERFLEANVFTSHANGNAYFELAEGIEYAGFLGSTKTLAKPIYDFALAHCDHHGTDLFGRPLVDTPCFRSIFFDRTFFREHIGPALPRMADTFEKLDKATAATFMKNLELAARKGKYDDDPMDSFDAENFVMVMSYIESMFKRFDVDRTGSLTMPQALAAFPIVCPKLKDLSGLPGTCKPRWGMLESLFGHFLVYGSAPAKASKNLGDKIVKGVDFLGWMVRWATIRGSHADKYRVDRVKLLTVITALSTQGKTSSLDLDLDDTVWDPEGLGEGEL